MLLWASFWFLKKKKQYSIYIPVTKWRPCDIVVIGIMTTTPRTYIYIYIYISFGCVSYETVEAVVSVHDSLSVSRSTVSVAMIVH